MVTQFVHPIDEYMVIHLVHPILTPDAISEKRLGAPPPVLKKAHFRAEELGLEKLLSKLMI